MMTLEEVVKRVVIPLKRGDPTADAIRKSRFLNFYNTVNSQGVLPIGDDLIEFTSFSSGEFAITLLPEEIAGNGREVNPQTYTDGGRECRYFHTKLGDELQGKTVYFIASPDTDPNWQPDQMVFRMAVAARTAKHIGADKVFAVFSEFPFARQDRGIGLYNRLSEGSLDGDKLKHAGQTDYISSVLLTLMVHGCDGVVTLHHHSDHLQSIVEDCLGLLGRSREDHYTFNLSPTPLIARYLQTTDILTSEEKDNKGEGIIFIAPDNGALEFVRTVREMSGYTQSSLAYIDKKRMRANDPGALKGMLVPVEPTDTDYRGKTGIVPDDMVDTFGTMNQALNKLPGEIKRFVTYATHAILGGQAEDRMRRHRRLSDVIFMDTRPQRLRDLGAGAKRKVTVIQPAAYIAHALANCVERSIEPNAYYKRLFAEDPSFFDGLFRIKLFDQHYSKQ
ncbi:hypothetical protein HZC31_06525 [Candidatus Woesearchaeota archaeon]|nr:hypothetical protein [Candidatus Woesearchaeota archaeon]